MPYHQVGGVYPRPAHHPAAGGRYPRPRLLPRHRCQPPGKRHLPVTQPSATAAGAAVRTCHVAFSRTSPSNTGARITPALVSSTQETTQNRTGSTQHTWSH